MPGTMTYVGFDVHARSAYAAAIDVMTGELSRVRFGSGTETPVDWLLTLPGPVRACYEAGPDGVWAVSRGGRGRGRDGGDRAGVDTEGAG
jgi:hypothetical protein